MGSVALKGRRSGCTQTTQAIISTKRWLHYLKHNKERQVMGLYDDLMKKANDAYAKRTSVEVDDDGEVPWYMGQESAYKDAAAMFKQWCSQHPNLSVGPGGETVVSAVCGSNADLKTKRPQERKLNLM
jgi:hypothetical protein